MATARHHRFDFVEYVELVEERNQKHEFLDGQILALSGGTPEHARNTTNISHAIAGGLSGKRCAVFSPDLRVRSRVTGLATYADVTVICGKVELDPEDPKRHTALNPMLLVEVLSPSTEDYDRGEKLRHYQTMDSLEEIVLVSWDRREVEVVRRARERGEWTRHISRAGERVTLESIGVDVSVDDVYRDPLAD